MPRDPLAPVWKALADPTRRALLDTLRDGPQTTGELCRLFESSRFAVMKHLGILTAARLVVVEWRGRERWNHLNVVPIRQVYERWVKPYEAQWAASLLCLKDQVETAPQGEVMPTPSMVKAEFGVAHVELEISIKATPERVWQALVEETTKWWSKDFYTSPTTRGFHIEPRLGGRAYEDMGDGAGLIWFTVIGLQPAKSLLLKGHLTAAYGGPAGTFLELELKPSGKKTVLRLSDTAFGCVSEKLGEQLEEGWKTLFEDGLKRYVEA